MGKIAIVTLKSEGSLLDGASNLALERELKEIMSGMVPSKRLPRYWLLEKITVLDA